MYKQRVFTIEVPHKDDTDPIGQPQPYKARQYTVVTVTCEAEEDRAIYKLLDVLRVTSGRIPLNGLAEAKKYLLAAMITEVNLFNLRSTFEEQVQKEFTWLDRGPLPPIREFAEYIGTLQFIRHGLVVDVHHLSCDRYLTVNAVTGITISQSILKSLWRN